MKLINNYKIKDGITLDDVIEEVKKKKLSYTNGGLWINKDAVFTIWITLADEITLNIGFPKNLNNWDCFNYVLVLDDSFGQPYTPFYNVEDDTHVKFPFLMNVIGNYNKIMDSLNFLERK